MKRFGILLATTALGAALVAIPQLRHLGAAVGMAAVGMVAVAGMVAAGMAVGVARAGAAAVGVGIAAGTARAGTMDGDGAALVWAWRAWAMATGIPMITAMATGTPTITAMDTDLD